MSRYAIIENAQVINVIEYESDPGNPPAGFAEDVIAVQSDAAQPGDQYVDGQFINHGAPPFTDEERKQLRIAELKQLLTDSDYKVLPDYDKPDEGVKAQRQAWRLEIRTLEAQT
jgi:hypothetical protein